MSTENLSVQADQKKQQAPGFLFLPLIVKEVAVLDSLSLDNIAKCEELLRAATWVTMKGHIVSINKKREKQIRDVPPDLSILVDKGPNLQRR